MLRALFLDVGGTLLTEVPARFEIYAEEAVSRGLRVDGAEMEALMRRAHGELPLEIEGSFRYSDPWFAAFIERIYVGYLGLGARALPELTQALFARFEDAASFRLYDGAIDLLRDMRARGLVCGVVSNWSARLPRVLANTGLAAHLDFALSSALERAEKPNAALFERALARAGVPAQQALHAGDHRRRDVEGARRVGIEAVLVDHAGTASAAPSAAVRSLPELHALLVARLP